MMMFDLAFSGSTPTLDGGTGRSMKRRLGRFASVLKTPRLTTLGRPATEDLDMLTDLQMPLKGLSQTL